MTVILYLTGRPGTGKYTISQELAKSGYVVCDNQLINNPIFALLNYDGFSKIPEFAWNSIEEIRNSVFDFILKEPDNNYILTNVLYENDGDHELYKKVKSMAANRGSLFVPIKLTVSEKEHLARITESSRRIRWKSIDPAEVYVKHPLIKIDHKNLCELEVTELTATQAAEKISEHIKTILVSIPIS